MTTILTIIATNYAYFNAGIYSTIIYWSVGLQPYADRYFLFVATLLLTTFCAMSLGFMVSAASPSKLVANAVGPPLLIILLLFGNTG